LSFSVFSLPLSSLSITPRISIVFDFFFVPVFLYLLLDPKGWNVCLFQFFDQFLDI
jgi:hypothetical protein